MLSCVDFGLDRDQDLGDGARQLSLFGNLHTPGRSQHLLDIAIDSELPSGERAHHEQPCPNARITAPQTQLFRDLDQTAGGPLSRQALGLVDLAEHRVGGLGDDGGGEASHETGAQVDHRLHAVRGLGFVDALVNGLGDLFVDDEFGHGVGDPVKGVWVVSHCLYIRNGEREEEEIAHCLNKMGPKPE